MLITKIKNVISDTSNTFFSSFTSITLVNYGNVTFLHLFLRDELVLKSFIYRGFTAIRGLGEKTARLIKMNKLKY